MFPKSLLTLGLCLGCGLIAYVYFRKKRTINKRLPKKWRKVGVLVTARVFPMKSCGPLELGPDTEYTCDTLGLRLGNIRDRGLMCVDELGRAITYRECPHMQFIEPRVITPFWLMFQTPDVNVLPIELYSKDLNYSNAYIEAKIKDIPVTGRHLQQPCDLWFSRALLQKDYGVQVVYYHHDKPVRGIMPLLRDQPDMTTADTGTFSDHGSYMLLNLTSLSAVNEAEDLPAPLHPLQFRSNFDIRTDDLGAHCETQWKWIRIGEKAIFQVIRCCPHYMMLMDKEEGDQDFFKKYRVGNLYPGPPIYGLILGLRQRGVIKENDVVYVADA